MNWTTAGIALFLLYWLLVSHLSRKGILERYNITSYGPLLMIRTTRGLQLLDRLAVPKKAWRLFADVGIRLMFIGMFAMLLIVIVSDISMLSSLGDNTMPEPNKFNEARNIFLIPGVNEFIPLTWGLIALIVTLVVHEFSHAILCRVENIRVKSMGILLALVPVGGFAEPDENELFGTEATGKEGEGPVERTGSKAATRQQRARILAAGVMANFVVALLAFILFFGPVLGAIAPIGNVMVMDAQGEASAAGLESQMIITQINDKPVDNIMGMLEYLDTFPEGETVRLYASKDRVTSAYDIRVGPAEEDIRGVLIQDIVAASPAEAAGLQKGMRIIQMDTVPMRTVYDFRSFMNTTSAGQSVTLVLADNTSGKFELTLELASHPDEGNDKGFLGVFTSQDENVATRLGITVGEFPATTYLSLLDGIPGMLKGIAGWLILLGLPIVGFAGEGFPGFSGMLANFYTPAGWAEPLGIGIFWIANSLLWIGWLNFYVGLFNCLPAVPLDGGHIFKDYIKAFIYRLTRNEERSLRLSTAVTATFAVLIFMSFMFMIFGPYLVHGF
ncbi:site-2 protease family protein [uncultured Methanomethylovorans sp.]|uniref:site-2 protease family protein n=1 Tax=uncultured Methanomethylovorans sp. TaxID=183759 RepID=UPI002623B9D3|nr:site-2 protease family protein [uncultured Methanomethylovorans sp.]